MARSRSERRSYQAKADRKAKAIAVEYGTPEAWVAFRHNRRVCSCYLCSGTDAPARQVLQANAAVLD